MTNDEKLRLAKEHRADQVRRFQEELKILRDRYKASLEANGPKHPETLAHKAKWKRGIKISNDWMKEHPAIIIKHYVED